MARPAARNKKAACQPRDDWQAYITREAAKAVGSWLEARGRLHHSISRLTMPELEAIAEAAISRWVVLQSQQMRTGDDPGSINWLLAG
jgi:hypothetical protein